MMLVNGEPATALPLADRAIQYGDGVFRTLRVENGRPLWWNEQYAKLDIDCKKLQINTPSEALLLADIARLAPHNHALKIIITRGESARGYTMPQNSQPNRIVQIAPLPVYAPALWQNGAIIRLCATRCSWQPALAGVKHLNRLENVLARAEWDNPAIFEGLMLDQHDRIAEGVFSNVFARINGIWHTHPLDACGVAGVARSKLIELLAKNGQRVTQTAFSLAELHKADAVCLTNSLAILVPVGRLADTGHSWPIVPELAELRASLHR